MVLSTIYRRQATELYTPLTDLRPCPLLHIHSPRGHLPLSLRTIHQAFTRVTPPHDHLVPGIATQLVQFRARLHIRLH